MQALLRDEVNRPAEELSRSACRAELWDVYISSTILPDGTIGTCPPSRDPPATRLSCGCRTTPGRTGSSWGKSRPGTMGQSPALPASCPAATRAPLRRGSRRERHARAGCGSAGRREAGVLGPHRVRGRPRGIWRVRRPGPHRSDQVRGRVVHRFSSRLVRRALVVGGGHCGGRRCGRPAAAPHPSAGGGSRRVRRAACRARRPGVGAGNRGRLGGVADRWLQCRPGEGAEHRGRRGRQLDLPAKGGRHRGFPGEHAGGCRRHLCRGVLQPGGRGAADHGGRPSGRTAVLQGPRREHRGGERLVRDLLRNRRHRAPGRLPGAAVRVRGLAVARCHPSWPVRGPW